jgi:hypothetical protein
MTKKLSTQVAIAVLVGVAIGGAASTYIATGVPDCLVHLTDDERQSMTDQELWDACETRRSRGTGYSWFRWLLR